MPDDEPSEGAAVSRRLRVAAVGCLGVRSRFGPVLRHAPFVELVGTVETDPTLLKIWQRETGRMPTFASVTALFESDVRPDAVMIASPVPERASQIATCIANGAAVLSEAPFGDAPASVEAALKAASAAGVTVAPVFPYRFEPLLAQAIQAARSGEVGELRQVRCEWRFPISQALAWERGAPPDGDPWTSLLRYSGCQTVDLARWWLGDALSVSADLDMPTADGTLAKRGALAQTQANIIVTHCAGTSTHHLARARSQVPGERFLLSGSRGSIETLLSVGEGASAGAIPRLTRARHGERPEALGQAMAEDSPTGHAEHDRSWRMLRHFTDCLLVGAPPIVTAEDALAAQRVVDAAFISSLEHLKLSLRDGE